MRYNLNKVEVQQSCHKIPMEKIQEIFMTISLFSRKLKLSQNTPLRCKLGKQSVVNDTNIKEFKNFKNKIKIQGLFVGPPKFSLKFEGF